MEVDSRSEVKKQSDIARHSWQFMEMIHKTGVATMLVTSDKVLEELIKKNSSIRFPMMSSFKGDITWSKCKGISVIIDPNSIDFSSLNRYYCALDNLSRINNEKSVVVMRYDPFLCKETQVPYKFINKHSSVVIRTYREVYK